VAVRGAEGRVDDLERLFHTLVDVLKDENPEQIRSAFQVSELYQSILPYRIHKRRLGFDTNQDYEMAVLRLLGGERNYVTVEPEEVMIELAEEAQAISPNPAAFREYAAARVTLNPRAVRSLERISDAYAPPVDESGAEEETASASAVSSQHTPPAPIRPPVFEPVEDVASRRDEEPDSPPPPETPTVTSSCPQCGEDLPSAREVVFCPFCGARVGTTECAKCGETIEPGWRFCPKCGTPDRSA
jgi:hypothetical protein